MIKFLLGASIFAVGTIMSIHYFHGLTLPAFLGIGCAALVGAAIARK